MKSLTLLAVSLFSASALAQNPLWGQCGGNGWTGSTACESGACCTFSNEWYSQCTPCSGNGGGSSSTSTTTSATPTNGGGGGGGGGDPTGVTTVFPQASGETALPTARVISGHFDGGMVRYSRSPDTCQEQTETDEAAAMFILEAGGSISNVILSKAQAEGIHCRGTCTLTNVWWEDVCEDAATFKQTSGTSYINGGGARKASDKIFQFNGRGTVSIKNFYAEDYGKVIRSCGDCTGNGGPRHVIIDNVIAKDGGPLCGINSNYGDTCRISNSCQNNGKICDRYEGVTKGNGSSKKLGTGPDNSSCFASGFTESC
ncbi:hypothetical protein AJ80_01143 [Polytolypa hystricis UAMH7299]|uniref:Pectate lyase n=1 Tax=Polytolypa hystricis (strain UAMH7299) TaxID=1447883 RepID=A0A2B7YZS3_POLH7|nr:hypothetical protein AJ80_01143 [Polytolypa hystricis UAMH7299]